MENGIIKYDSSTVQTIKETVAQYATDAELRMFIEMCKSTGLNPFKKEIWFIKTQDKQGRWHVHMMTGINGYHRIANDQAEYDGLEAGFVGADGSYLPLTYPKNDFIGAWAKVYRKDRRVATEGVAMREEYDKGFGNWKTMPRVMLQKCAESVALRKAFPQQLNGLLTQEEMPEDYNVPQPPAEPITVADVKKAQAARAEQASPATGTIRYQLPFKSDQIDIATWRKKLAASGFKPDKSVTPWIWEGASTTFDELVDFLVMEQVAPEDTIEEDELPAEWEDDGYQQSLEEAY